MQENEREGEEGQRKSSPRRWGEAHPGLAWRGSGEGRTGEVSEHQRRRQWRRRKAGCGLLKEHLGMCSPSDQSACVH